MNDALKCNEHVAVKPQNPRNSRSAQENCDVPGRPGALTLRVLNIPRNDLKNRFLPGCIAKGLGSLGFAYKCRRHLPNPLQHVDLLHSVIPIFFSGLSSTTRKANASYLLFVVIFISFFIQNEPHEFEQVRVPTRKLIHCSQSCHLEVMMPFSGCRIPCLTPIE